MSTQTGKLSIRERFNEAVPAQIAKGILAAGLSLLSIVSLGPLFVFLINSVKVGGGVAVKSYEVPSQITIKNYIIAWTQGGFNSYMLNSILIVGVSLALIVICSYLATYAIVRFDFKSKELIIAIILSGFMIPTQILIVPRFLMMSWLSLIDTYASLVLVYVASALPFSIFLLRQYLVDVPDSLADAAVLDGCSELQVMYRIYAPLSMPAISAVVVFQFVLLWNEFLYAITFIRSDAKRPLSAGLMNYTGAYGTEWAKLMAGIGIAVIPTLIFFIMFRDQFLKSINMRVQG